MAAVRCTRAGDRHPAELPADARRTSAIPYARGEPVYDITFENVQAGERTSHLFRLANFHGGFVVGTGDLSELALGWCTYGVGDHMSHYNVNASVPKTLIKHLVRWVAASGSVERGDDPVLDEILATEISPELVPGDAQGRSPTQSSEASVGPYELQDFHLYHILRYGYAPTKVAFLAWTAWHDAGQGDWPDAPDVPAQRLHAGRDQEAPAHLPAGASSRPASSSARACRTRPRSARAARSRRAATGARRAIRKRRCGSTTSSGSPTR